MWRSKFVVLASGRARIINTIKTTGRETNVLRLNSVFS